MENQPHWLEQRRYTRWLWPVFIFLLICAVIAELLIHGHPHFWLDSLFAFNAWFGFLACAAMLVVAKGLALFLKRPDTYYEDSHD